MICAKQAVKRNDAACVHQALRNKQEGYDEIIRIILDAGADPWWTFDNEQDASSGMMIDDCLQKWGLVDSRNVAQWIVEHNANTI